MQPRALILRTAGTNCDAETARAFELAGASSHSLHLNALIAHPRLLDEFQILALPGGFSYGDDISAGRILANQLVHHLGEAMRGFVAAGKPIIGICNGFQVLVKSKLLGGPVGSRGATGWTLTYNGNGRFIDRWVHVCPSGDKCIWTKDLHPMEMPVAHGEGRFIALNDASRSALWNAGRVALIYCTADGRPAGGKFPENPNGSLDDIAGICDASGLVLGLMPHPERHVSTLQHPAWTQRRETESAGPGMLIFRNAVNHVHMSIGAGI